MTERANERELRAYTNLLARAINAEVELAAVRLRERELRDTLERITEAAATFSRKYGTTSAQEDITAAIQDARAALAVSTGGSNG